MRPWSGMVIGIDHPHIHKGKYAPYIEVCEPQGPIIRYKGQAFSKQPRQPLISGLVWLQVLIIHTLTMVNMSYMLKYVGPRGLYLNIKGLLF